MLAKIRPKQRKDAQIGAVNYRILDRIWTIHSPHHFNLMHILIQYLTSWGLGVHGASVVDLNLGRGGFVRVGGFRIGDTARRPLAVVAPPPAAVGCYAAADSVAETRKLGGARLHFSSKFREKKL